MGVSEIPKECFLTQLETHKVNSKYIDIEYVIHLSNDKRLKFKFPFGYARSNYVTHNLHIIKGLIYNNSFPLKYINKDAEVLDNEILEKIIKDANYPKSSEDKLSNLLNYLHSKQAYLGAEIEIPSKYTFKIKNKLAHSLYFQHTYELDFFIRTLEELGYIDIKNLTKAGIERVNLTYKGLTKVIENKDNGALSNKCFIAMSFTDNIKINAIREAIRESVEYTKYEVILIDEKHINSDVTINDAIISEIRKSKFMIADFTENKHGVYFEAGFANGLGKKVIYTCQKDDMKDVHFDTKHYSHIVYENVEELKTRLINKIEAWIL